MEVNFKVSLDDKDLQRQLQEDVAKKAKGVIAHQLDNFFTEKTHWRPQGIGHRDIETKLIEVWESPKFQARIDKMFEEEWETIFRAALVKAATHKANGIAFNRVKHLDNEPVQGT